MNFADDYRTPGYEPLGGEILCNLCGTWHDPGSDHECKYLPCVGEEDENGVWHCAVCGQPGNEDCLEEPHLIKKDDEQ